ncbi:hypothetical protein BJX70DRAFT_403716 [Aspergillus crustosus]
MPLSLLLSFLSLSSIVLAAYSPQLEILYWPLTKSEPSTLAHVSYDPASLKSDLIDYYPPIESSQDLVRVGFYIAIPSNPKQWVGTLTSLSALRADATLHLHISLTNEIYHISVNSAAASTSRDVTLSVVTDKAGPSPHLNRPVVVGPDGKNPEEEPEKTLFQKYWWVLLIVTFLAMSGGGEQQ